MKKIIFLATALSLVFAAGCKKDEQPENKDGRKVEFVIEETATRTVTEGNTTRFVEGDKIGVTSTGLAAEMNNALFTVGADGRLTGSAFYYEGNNTATFFAHYPASAPCNAGAVAMTVGTDQSTAELFNANDFMTATAIGDPAVNNGVVSLKFYHRLTLVKVKWTAETDVISVSLDNIKPVMTWKHSDNSLTASGETVSIKTWEQDQTQEFWALVPSQTIAAATELITIRENGKSYNYITAGDVTFNANTIKTITLSIAADDAVEAVFGDIEIEDWGNDAVDGGGNVTEYDPPQVKLITLEESRNITLTPGTKGNAAPGVWTVDVDDATTANNVIEFVTTDETDRHLHMNVEKGNWWDNAIYWRPDAELADKIMPKLYKLTFEAKASEANKGFIVHVMDGTQTVNTFFGIINSDPTSKPDVVYNTQYYPSFKEDQVGTYQPLTYWIDFGTKCWKELDEEATETEGKNVYKTVYADAGYGDYTNVLLTFTINTSNGYGTDFHIRNIVFEEVK